MYEKILVSNIQRFSLHDGPGIRSTVFLMGCSIRCPWCCNPENLYPMMQTFYRDGKYEQYGKYLTVEEIFKTVMKDKVFYGDENIEADELAKLPGGVTFSGGEALLQTDKLTILWEKLKKAFIHIAVETALFVNPESIRQAIRYIDLFYVDIKTLNASKCERVLGGDIYQYLANVKSLFDARQKVVFRIPVIGGYTDTQDDMDRIVRFLMIYKPLKVEIIRGHNLAKSKYVSLGKKPPFFREVNDMFLKEYQSRIAGLGITTEICKV